MTISDDIRKEALLYKEGKITSTGQVLKLLGLKDDPINFEAGNKYWAALSIISKTL